MGRGRQWIGCGRSSVFYQILKAFENVLFSDFEDAADGADAVSPSSSVGAKEKKKSGWSGEL